MKRIVIALALILAGCTSIQSDRKSLAWSEDNALLLDLQIVAVPQGDLQRAQLRLTATNTGTKPIVLDRELRAGFRLRFKTDLSEEFISSDDRDVSTNEVRKLDKPEPGAAKVRFVSLKPGDSLSRTYDLSKPMEMVVEGHMSDMDSVHYGFYYEEFSQFVVPSKAKELMVDAWYERGVWMMAVPQFEEWHGVSPEKIGLWQGRARSDTVTVKGKQ